MQCVSTLIDGSASVLTEQILGAALTCEMKFSSFMFLYGQPEVEDTTNALQAKLLAKKT